MSFVGDVDWGMIRQFPEFDAEYSRSWTTYMIFFVRTERQYLILKICAQPGGRGPLAALMVTGSTDVNVSALPSTE